MNRTKKIALCGALVALALALSLVESTIPLGVIVPVPGIKLGLANVVTLVSLYLLGVQYAWAISIARVLLVFMMTGNVTAMILSAFGAIFSLLAMILAKKAGAFSIFGVSIIGAACHNIGQISAAIFIMQSVGIVYYLPILLVTSIITGFLTASAADACLKICNKPQRH